VSATCGRRSSLPWSRIVAGLAVLIAFLAASLVLWQTGVLDRLLDSEALEQAVVRLGPLGPALIIGQFDLLPNSHPAVDRASRD